MTFTQDDPPAPESPARTGTAESGAAALARSWAPTALGSSMLAWEIPLVVAIAARMPDGADAVAALGVGLSVLFVANSPALAMAPLVVAELAGQGSRALLRWAAATGLAGSAALTACAAVPGLREFLPQLLGLPGELHDAFRLSLLSFATAPLAVALRRYLHGRLITRDTTRAIAVSTGVRIAATGLAGLVAWWTGVPAAAAGGLALSAGAWAETAGLLLAVRRLAPVPAARARGLLVQHARITSSVLLNMSPALVTTVVLTRAASAEDSLVVWPAIYGLLSLGTVPLSDLDTVGAAFLRRSGRPGTLSRFTFLLAGGLLGAGLLVALTPLARLYLVDFSHVPDGPAGLGLRWIALLAVVPALWAVRGRLRARALAEERTRILPRAALAHLIGMIGLGLLLVRTPLPGVACASLALIGALVIEMLALRGVRTGRPGPGT
ncbi:hypothetical protein [Streptomyces sp. HNM0574]|uniref:hypothetical protein n=1 Tax=Streptomyces sp. HNM0574 TaxID=2714954 RepID=UPI001469D70B|nr:hypothetical protein [Streptomyces sp. HNM0574]NLU71026.1 hypothetical protein [Streptomyces sp. HNM0574]